jgi:hypothetical protein
VKPELVFMEWDDDERGINMAETPIGTVEVLVNGNYRVVHKQPYGGGDVFDAPDNEGRARASKQIPMLPSARWASNRL